MSKVIRNDRYGTLFFSLALSRRRAALLQIRNARQPKESSVSDCAQLIALPLPLPLKMYLYLLVSVCICICVCVSSSMPAFSRVKCMTNFQIAAFATAIK